MYTHVHTSFHLFTFGSKIECYNICFIIFDPPEALWHLVRLFFLLRDDSLILWSRWRKYLAECLHCDNYTSGRERRSVFEHAQKARSRLHFFLLRSPMYKLERISVLGEGKNKYTDFEGATGLLPLTSVQHLSQVWVLTNTGSLLTVQLWTASLMLFLMVNRINSSKIPFWGLKVKALPPLLLSSLCQAT